MDSSSDGRDCNAFLEHQPEAKDQQIAVSAVVNMLESDSHGNEAGDFSCNGQTTGNIPIMNAISRGDGADRVADIDVAQGGDCASLNVNTHASQMQQ